MDEATEFGSSEAGKLGGRARADKLSKEERASIARAAAEARWGPLPQATHGSESKPITIGDVDIPCYVLDDERRVLVQGGMLTALDMSQGTASAKGGGDRLGKFITTRSISPYVSKGLSDLIIEPIRFRTTSGTQAYGYEATVLADLCDAVLEARKSGKLNYQQEHIAEQCEILVRSFARVGIVALVDEATGYQSDRARDALARILEAFVAKELQKWISTFKLDYYEQLFRLWKVKYDPFRPTMKRPQFFGTLTNNIVYERLAPGVLEELRKKNPTNETGHRANKHFQHLTPDLGHPKLKEHLAAVTALMRASTTKEQFKKMLDMSLPKYKDSTLFISGDRADLPGPSSVV
jgi:hypothetical protein